MTEAVFYVDEQGFAFTDESVAAIEQALDTFLQTINDPGVANFSVSCWSQIWDVQSQSGQPLSEILWSNSEVDPLLRRQVGNMLDRASHWDDEQEFAQLTLETTCDGRTISLSPSIALCRLQRDSGRTVALISTNQSGRRGLVAVSLNTDDELKDMSFIVDPSDVIDFWRAEVEHSDYSVVQISEVSALLFRSLRFADNVWSQFSRFAGEYRTIRRQFMRDLCGLDDHILRIRKAFDEPHRVAIEMRSAAGVDCSPESPLTRANRAAMSQRDVVFEGRTVRCEWHTKLEPHRNRIHFAVYSEFVLIGIFAEHLQT